MMKHLHKYWSSPICSMISLIVLSNLTPAHAKNDNGLIETVKQIEKQLGSRIGVSVYDEETGQNWEYHADELFPMASTFKTLACGTLLSRVDSGQEELDRVVIFDEMNLVTYSPITKTRVGSAGMSLSELCEATMSMSDNTAANLILEAIGGPRALTEFVSSLGDKVTRLDRWEPDLNEATPGDVRDTTSPGAMARTLRRLVLGDALSQQSRERLTNWLKGNMVGDALLRAGVPNDWIVADRTGAGGHGSRAIAAIMWTPEHKPIIATVYITETEAAFDARNAAIAQIGVAIVKEVSDR